MFRESQTALHERAQYAQSVQIRRKITQKNRHTQELCRFFSIFLLFYTILRIFCRFCASKSEKRGFSISTKPLILSSTQPLSCGAFTPEVNKHSKSEGHQEQGQYSITDRRFIRLVSRVCRLKYILMRTTRSFSR